MASNAEILAQLEKLAEMECAYGPIEQLEFTRLRYSPGKTPDFPAILAAVKRWIKIEKAHKSFCEFITQESDCDREADERVKDAAWEHLAALKEPA